MKVDVSKLEKLIRSWEVESAVNNVTFFLCEIRDVAEAYKTCSEQLRELIQEEKILDDIGAYK